MKTLAPWKNVIFSHAQFSKSKKATTIELVLECGHFSYQSIKEKVPKKKRCLRCWESEVWNKIKKGKP